MPAQEVLTSQLHIKVAGREVDQAVMAQLDEVVVEQHTHLPGMFQIRLHDPDLSLTDDGTFDLTDEVEIVAETADDTKVTLIKGEITALEPQFEEGRYATLVVRGYDKLHRLYRMTKSQAFLNKKDSDLATTVAQAAGLQAEIDKTQTVYEHIYQDNQSDLAFLMQRAWRIGFECFVDDGKLYFRKPSASGAAAVTLEWGLDLLCFYPSMTLGEQVNQVAVKGWDVEKQKAIIGKATSGELYPQIGESKDGSKWANNFGRGIINIVDQPVISQAEANLLAQARLNELSGTFIDAEGVALRRPDIRAGKIIELKNLGTRFSGKYLVTGATHVYNIEGLTTNFTVRGMRTGSLVEVNGHHEPRRRWPGVVTAVVTNNDDPKKWGRVKVKFPWMSDEAESNWARVVQLGAGAEAGFLAIPSVNDEVLVAFEHADINHPFVLGGMWNGKNKMPTDGSAAKDKERAMRHVWRLPGGHQMAMYGNDADKRIEIITAGGHTFILSDKDKKIEVKSTAGHKLLIDDQNKKVELASSGGSKVTMDDNGRKVTVASSGDLDLTGTNINITAKAAVNVTGKPINLN